MPWYYRVLGSAGPGETVLGCIRHSVTIQSRDGIVVLCSALLQPHLENWVPKFPGPQYEKEIKLSESQDQRTATRMVKGLAGKPHEE